MLDVRRGCTFSSFPNFTDLLRFIPWTSETWKRTESCRAGCLEGSIAHRWRCQPAQDDCRIGARGMNTLNLMFSRPALFLPGSPLAKTARSQRCPWHGLYRLVSWDREQSGRGKMEGASRRHPCHPPHTHTQTSFLARVFSLRRYPEGLILTGGPLQSVEPYQGPPTP